MRKTVNVLLVSTALPFAAVWSPAKAGDGGAIAAGVLGGLAAGTIVGIAATTLRATASNVRRLLLDPRQSILGRIRLGLSARPRVRVNVHS